MKKKFMKFAMNLISSNNNYNEEKLDEIAYGLEAIYLMITKIIVLFGLAFILGIVKEFVLLLIFYNIIRTNAFGIHASKSIYCLLSSSLLFIGGAYLCMNIVIPLELMVMIAIVCIVCLFRYAPADTYKRPIVNKKKRMRFKIFSLLSGIVYLVLIVVLNNYSIVNYIFIGLVEAVIMILPFTYKIFGLPYDNYKKYECGV